MQPPSWGPEQGAHGARANLGGHMGSVQPRWLFSNSKVKENSGCRDTQHSLSLTASAKTTCVTQPRDESGCLLCRVDRFHQQNTGHQLNLNFL